jgi:hypothetical protein
VTEATFITFGSTQLSGTQCSVEFGPVVGTALVEASSVTEATFITFGSTQLSSITVAEMVIVEASSVTWDTSFSIVKA